MADAKLLTENEVLVPGVAPANLSFLRLSSESDADIPIHITGLKPAEKANHYILTTEESLSSQETYLLASEQGSWEIAPSAMAVLFSMIIASALISNFVFTKYLGLCVFFGVSRKKDTAIGMGVTFTIVGILSGTIAWALNHIALEPLKLEFLQIIAFIGIIACLVQGTDLILKKVNPLLHSRFGIYLVLITTNCVILAVPLLNATAEATFIEALGLATGSGLGFGLALFMMSCARERVDMAPVPAVFQGLPIAFILAGLFALAFLGFSGLKVM